MDGTAAAVLAALPGWAFGFILVAARVGAATATMPGLGELDIPAPVRLGVALAVTAVLLPVVQPLLPAAPAYPVHLAALVAGETLVGVFLGFAARLVALALPVAGQVIAFMLGLSSVLQFDANLGGQSSPVGRFLGLAVVVLLFVSGLHHLPLRALAGSYAVLAPGAGLPAGEGAEQIVLAVGAGFGLAIQMAGPFVLGATVWQCSLGLLARLVPSVQFYFVAMPAQILGGLLLLAASLGILFAIWLDAARDHLSRLPGL